MENQSHEAWLNNEYELWEQDLSLRPINHFKQLENVIRMMGLADKYLQFYNLINDISLPWQELQKMDELGSPGASAKICGFEISGIGLRFIYYANKILDIIEKRKDIRIVEIGGGYGGMCATMHILAKHRNIEIQEYAIFDRPKVQKFQLEYLHEAIQLSSPGIKSIAFLNCNQLQIFNRPYNYVISFYALGEFDNKLKSEYIQHVISKVPHGFILWNPHSGADNNLDELLNAIPSNCEVTPEFPRTSPDNLQITF